MLNSDNSSCDTSNSIDTCSSKNGFKRKLNISIEIHASKKKNSIMIGNDKSNNNEYNDDEFNLNSTLVHESNTTIEEVNETSTNQIENEVAQCIEEGQLVNLITLFNYYLI